MSIAGVRSNRGDGYQTAVALGLVLDMLTDPQIACVEVDSTSLAADGAPIRVDDVVVRHCHGRTDYGQCKKNQKNFDSWTVDDLKDDLAKAGKTLTADSRAHVVLYSRSPFGEIQKLREYARTQPHAIAYRKGLTKELAKWQISANSTYSVPFDRFDGFVRALGRYSAAGKDPNRGETVPSAFIADIFLGARSNGLGEISLYAKNVFDRQDITRTAQAFGILGNPTGYYLLNVPRGREVGVQVRYDFASGQ